MNYTILLDKLNYYGIQGNALKWIESYLTGRQQKVTIKSHAGTTSSRWATIQHGVPQGGILSPILFSLYVNDIAVNIPKTSNATQFADDTSIAVYGNTSKELEENVSETMTALNSYFRANKLKSNEDKSVIMKYRTKSNKRDNNEQVDCKFLGFQLDYLLNWKSHTRLLGNHLNSACFALRLISKQTSRSITKMVYFATIHSKIAYGIILWGGSTNAEMIFKKQKRAIRILGNCRRRSSCKRLFKNLKILTPQVIHRNYKFSFLSKATRKCSRFKKMYTHVILETSKIFKYQKVGLR